MASVNENCTGANRREELLQAIKHEAALVPLVEDAIYLEQQLEELRKLPMLKVHPKDRTKQKPTPAAKQYKEFLQQYTNIIKVLTRAAGLDETEEESPLRTWMKQHVNTE